MLRILGWLLVALGLGVIAEIPGLKYLPLAPVLFAGVLIAGVGLALALRGKGWF